MGCCTTDSGGVAWALLWLLSLGFFAFRVYEAADRDLQQPAPAVVQGRPLPGESA
ncbi:MAG: hypothetical protein Q8R98_17210 [Rubrivivax sp.]|nr:hypothetical protein [Rubrivivax sp.]MDP3613578.1 hypothetical protein [Rubrivivax sp.]